MCKSIAMIEVALEDTAIGTIEIRFIILGGEGVYL